MEIFYVQILLIGHVLFPTCMLKGDGNVLIKNVNNEYNQYRPGFPPGVVRTPPPLSTTGGGGGGYPPLVGIKNKNIFNILWSFQ